MPFAAVGVSDRAEVVEVEVDRAAGCGHLVQRCTARAVHEVAGVAAAMLGKQERQSHSTMTHLDRMDRTSQLRVVRQAARKLILSMLIGRQSGGRTGAACRAVSRHAVENGSRRVRSMTPDEMAELRSRSRSNSPSSRFSGLPALWQQCRQLRNPYRCTEDSAPRPCPLSMAYAVSGPLQLEPRHSLGRTPVRATEGLSWNPSPHARHVRLPIVRNEFSIHP